MSRFICHGLTILPGEPHAPAPFLIQAIEGRHQPLAVAARRAVVEQIDLRHGGGAEISQHHAALQVTSPSCQMLSSARTAMAMMSRLSLLGVCSRAVPILL